MTKKRLTAFCSLFGEIRNFCLTFTCFSLVRVFSFSLNEVHFDSIQIDICNEHLLICHPIEIPLKGEFSSLNTTQRFWLKTDWLYCKLKWSNDWDCLSSDIDRFEINFRIFIGFCAKTIDKFAIALYEMKMRISDSLTVKSMYSWFDTVFWSFKKKNKISLYSDSC